MSSLKYIFLTILSDFLITTFTLLNYKEIFKDGIIVACHTIKLPVMNTKKVKFLVVRHNQKEANVTFGKAEEMSVFNTSMIKQYLKNIIARKGTQLEIDLSGVHSINEDWIDTLNFLSRIARKYNSSVRLIGVESEVLEMIELIRQYYFFDIQHVKPAC